jgi:hypothetical protein
MNKQDDVIQRMLDRLDGDDSSYIQSLIDDAVDGQTVVIPSKEYRIGRTIEVSKSIVAHHCVFECLPGFEGPVFSLSSGTESQITNSIMMGYQG